MQFSDLDLSKTYSYADYYKWTFDDRVELINGKVYSMMPGPSRTHQEISGNVYNIIKNYLHGKSCKVYSAPFDVRLPKKGIDDQSIFTVLQPDICVVSDLSKLDKKGCIGAPDIVVEILSRGNNSKELRNKYNKYEEAGVKEYWVMSPWYQMITIFTLHEGKFVASRFYSPGDSVRSSVLTGFTIDLTELFEDIDMEE